MITQKKTIKRIVATKKGEIMKITGPTRLKDILEIEQGEDILKKHGVPCMTCPMAAQELNTLTIEEISQIYNLSLDAILFDLNESKVSQKK